MQNGPDESPVATDAAAPAIPEEVRAALLHAVQAAASAARPLVGNGDPHAVDAAAVDALRAALATIDVDGRIVAGEGEKDDAPMLHPGERFGTGSGPAIDVAVDPVDGTRLAAAGEPGAMAILAAAPRGAFLDLGPAHYLDKLVHAGPDAGLDLMLPVGENLALLAEARGLRVADLTVAVQRRQRNAALAAAVAEAGARLHEFEHGDIERIVHAVASDGSLDLLLGVGGAPEGIIEAAIVRAHDGFMLARLAPQSRREVARIGRVGLDLTRSWTRDELCADPAFVAIAAVTECALEPAPAELVRVAPGRMTAELSSAPALA
ncbi:fructose-bisphosphatase class II [Agromyces sp. ISL-38]|uniref:fructose-bisphosphatase class II n=1 Tax=Agromyces sp. ISL-38 TaxID=2819107 RepID=UPI001BE8826F|nr:fructose-bisphosphatase class II [Agromyces sp. ISL-38]MBT2498844.1 fructose-bisphosphatase class II [Agromyces sp. ISL-38]MBT2516471.1 fructose-bisphosphatase class II [Streptomyces sp. ISL-90]